jgi:myo-inositol-1(or 4)-monophosphatase
MNYYLDAAIQMARDVGTLLLEHQKQTRLLGSKSTTIDLVTEADEQAQQEITRRIRQTFPDHSIIAEESDLPNLPDSPHSQPLHEESGYVWVIDPIDGTTNYWHGSPHFCVSIALCHRTQPIVGVIGAPRLGEIFWAAQGEGAWCETTGQTERLQVSTVKRLDQALVATGFPYERAPGTDNNLIEFGRVMPFVQGIRRAGSAALDLAYVAAGRLDGYWEFHVRPWDTMAGQVLVREAGGTISPVRPHGEMHGAGGILATNGPLHTPLHRQIMGDA